MREDIPLPRAEGVDFGDWNRLQFSHFNASSKDGVGKCFTM